MELEPGRSQGRGEASPGRNWSTVTTLEATTSPVPISSTTLDPDLRSKPSPMIGAPLHFSSHLTGEGAKKRGGCAWKS